VILYSQTLYLGQPTEIRNTFEGRSGLVWAGPGGLVGSRMQAGGGQGEGEAGEGSLEAGEGSLESRGHRGVLEATGAP
jgi:hypothetical protein